MHVILDHQQESQHHYNHEDIGHHHILKGKSPAGSSESESHQHLFKEFSLIFIRGSLSQTPSLIASTLPLIVMDCDLWPVMLEQPVFKSGSCCGQPDTIRYACQEIVLSYPNKAPPLV